MTRSPSAEPAKASKRKGTRSVSTLTPSQLARKRANDREAQRAIRARTKEHIERLERELEELKSRHNRDDTVQALLRRNRELEQQLRSMQESFGLPSRPYQAPGYDIEGIPPAGSGVSSRTSSFGQGSADFSAGTPGFGSYLPTPEPCDSWQTVVPVSAVSVPSVVSSPCSSAGHPEDYVPGYIPTSVPASMMGGTVIPPTNIPCLDDNKVEFEEIDNTPTEQGYPQPNVPHTPTAYIQQQPWQIYPTPNYYSQSSAL